MVAICRNKLSGVALVPISTISGVITVIEKGVLGAVETTSVSQGGPCSSVKLPHEARHYFVVPIALGYNSDEP